MTVTGITLGNGLTRHIEYATDSQLSTNTNTVLSGSEMDMRGWTTLCYTFAVATNTVTISVLGANASDYSDEVVVDATGNIAAGSTDSYTVSPAPYSYYRVKIDSTSDGQHGTVTVYGTGK